MKFITQETEKQILNEALQQIALNLKPEEVFPESALRDWAESKGYTPAECLGHVHAENRVLQQKMTQLSYQLANYMLENDDLRNRIQKGIDLLNRRNTICGKAHLLREELVQTTLNTLKQAKTQ